PRDARDPCPNRAANRTCSLKKKEGVSDAQLLKISIERDERKPNEMFVDHDLPRLVDEAIDILAEDKRIFERSGALVRVRRTAAPRKRDKVKREVGSLVVGDYPAHAMRERLIAETAFFKLENVAPKGKPPEYERVRCGLPGDIVPTLRARPSW